MPRSFTFRCKNNPYNKVSVYMKKKPNAYESIKDTNNKKYLYLLLLLKYDQRQVDV